MSKIRGQGHGRFERGSVIAREVFQEIHSKLGFIITNNWLRAEDVVINYSAFRWPGLGFSLLSIMGRVFSFFFARNIPSLGFNWEPARDRMQIHIQREYPKQFAIFIGEQIITENENLLVTTLKVIVEKVIIETK